MAEQLRWSVWFTNAVPKGSPVRLVGEAGAPKEYNFVDAHRLVVRGGALIFLDERDQLVCAVGPSSWSNVALVTDKERGWAQGVDDPDRKEPSEVKAGRDFGPRPERRSAGRTV